MQMQKYLQKSFGKESLGNYSVRRKRLKSRTARIIKNGWRKSGAVLFAFLFLISTPLARAGGSMPSSPAIPAVPRGKKSRKPPTRHRYKKHMKAKPGKKAR